MSNGNLNQHAIDFIKIPPHSIEAEQAVLGGLILNNQALDAIAVKLVEADFYQANHRLIYNAILGLDLRKSPFDVLTLTEALKLTGELDKLGGEAYLFELANNTPSASNIEAYANIVRERSVSRQLIAIANEIADSAFNPEGRNANELLEEAERKVFGIAEKRVQQGGPLNVKELTVKAVEKIDTLYNSKQAIVGVPTGFKDFDELTSGLQNSDLIIVAARPSMGKTTFAMNIAEYVAIRENKSVLVFSMEMPGDALVMRMLSSLGHIDQHRVRTGKLTDDDWPRLTSAIGMLSEAKMFIDDTPALSPAEMRTRARRLVKEQGEIGMIVIDYLQLMQIPGHKENRTLEISEISRSLKALAKELKVPVIALSQLNRALEQRADKRPMMSDLRESGSIEQDADLITFIYRDEVYHPDSADKGVAEIILAKHRNGPIGKVNLTFLGQFTRFDNFAPNTYI